MIFRKVNFKVRSLELKVVSILSLVMFFFGGVTIWKLYQYTKVYEVRKERSQLNSLARVKGGILSTYFQQMKATINELPLIFI